MAKPIYLEEDMIESILEEVRENLQDVRMMAGSLQITKNYDYEDKKTAELVFTQDAYWKYRALVNYYSTEVGWHGLVRREADNVFKVYDILTYPQVVTGATVNTDDEEYAKWMMELTDEQANDLHFHGHSHVRMGVTASTVDFDHQKRILSSLDRDTFYIFMITNKNEDNNFWIYDMLNNIKYEKDDITLSIEGINTHEVLTLVENSKKQVVEKSSLAKTSVTTAVSTTAASSKTATAKKKGSAKSTASKTAFSKKKEPSFFGDDYDDFDDIIYPWPSLPGDVNWRINNT